ncbi:MAG: hypothetical protein CMF29_08040 [Kiritimatiellaceae bacterium]|nr:hypothetical protein [Kiritimatiellaceae bacterium]|tara:strand:+ start:1202 stop:1480 length:279 start_codon:yes stop_codon:yes gene_type:complete
MTGNLKEEWWEFHKANPHVYNLFCDYANKAIASGRKHYSARTIIELIRWHNDIETTESDFKINDHVVPYYARLFMHYHPEHKGFFELRQLRN